MWQTLVNLTWLLFFRNCGPPLVSGKNEYQQLYVIISEKNHRKDAKTQHVLQCGQEVNKHLKEFRRKYDE